MASPRSSKRDIDRAKRERAALKRERRQQSAQAEADGAPAAAEPDTAGPSSEQDVLRALDELHARYEAEELDFDAFEDAKTALLNRLV